MAEHQHRHGKGKQWPHGRGYCRLNDLQPGDQAKIRRHHARGAIRQRLLDLGFTPYTEINVIRRAPLGDPIECQLDGFNVALRLTEAALIEVER